MSIQKNKEALEIKNHREPELIRDSLLRSAMPERSDIIITESLDKNAESPHITQGKKNNNARAMEAAERLGIPAGLIQRIRVLANDRGKASEYFRPVVDSAKKLLDGCKNKEEAADELATLLASMFYYLDNRGASRYSRQRNARRAACSSVIEEIGGFLNKSETIFSNSIRLKVHSLKEADHPLNSEIERFSANYKNSLEDAYIAKQELFSLSGKSVTKEVSGIRIALEGLDSLLTNKMPPAPAKNAAPEKVKAYEDEIRYFGYGISKMYKKVLKACGNYLESHDTEPGIEKLVKDLADGYSHDSKVFANSISEYIAGQTGDGVVTWEDAIRSKSGVSVQLSDDHVQVLGSGTSIVYRYKKDGKFKYFKEEETVSKNLGETWDSIFKKVKESPSYSDEYDDDLKALDSAVRQQIADVADTDYGSAKKNDDLSALYTTLIRNFFIHCRGNVFMAVNALSVNSLEIIDQNPLFRYLCSIPRRSTAKKFISQIVLEFLKKFNSDIIARKNVNIKPGRTLSNRNAATSRMADLLGISNLVLKSETTEVSNGTKKIIGNVMDEAKGEPANIVLHFPTNKYTDNTINQIAIMHVFDLICGQVDRNTGNYYLTRDNNKITGLQMIDNDLSFGNFKEIGNTMSMVLPPMDYHLVDALSPEFKAQILKISKYTNGDLEFIFGDILDRDEIKSIKERLKIIADTINLREQQLREIADSESKQNKKRTVLECMGDDRFRALRYQYLTCLRVNAYLEAHKNEFPENEKKELARDYLRQISYLSYDNMMPFEELEREYRKYQE